MRKIYLKFLRFMSTFFTLCLEDSSVQDHYTILGGLLNKLYVYQPLVADISKMRQYRNELTVATYLSNLNPKLSSLIRGQILDANTVRNLQTTFFKVLWISTTTPAPISDRSAITATCGRGRSSGQGGDRGR